MEIFELEFHLLSEIERHNEFIRQCVSQEITFQDFLRKYNDFYDYYPLNGHESDSEELKLFEKHKYKIALHREISEVLNVLCSDEDAVKEIYKKAGRFGSEEGLKRLKEISKKYSIE